jgi:VCBS repeat-containing protein
MTFRVDDRSTDTTLVPAVLVTITENENGTLTFSITQEGAIVGDLRGVFFDVANEALVSHLTVSAAAGLTSVQRGDDSVVDLGGGANMQGLVGSDGGYDVGLQVGTAGIAKDDYRNFSFTLGTDNATALTLEDFANIDFGVRLTSVGTLAGARSVGEKLLETTSGPIDAIDDHATVKEDTAPSQATGNVLANDHNADPDHSTVVAVNGAAANVGSDIAGLYGTLHLNADGSYIYSLDNAKPSVQALAEGQQVSESFTYLARSYGDPTSYSDDSANLTITVTGTNDVVQITAAGGGSVAEDVAPSASGVVSFSDIDLSDTHVASFSPDAGNTTTLGTFALAPVNEAPNAAEGSVRWTYTLDNAAAQSLSEGQTVNETYVVRLDDGHGSVTTQTVTISIAGTNDAPTAQAISHSADEDGGPVVLNAVYSDVDALDTHTVSVDTTATHGTIVDNGNGSFSYDPHGQFEYLSAGQVASDTFTYTVADNHGGHSTATATVTVTGENDAPVFAAGGGSGIANGSFEDGFADWQTLGGLFLTIDHTDGNYGAQMVAGYYPVFTLEQFLGVAPGAIAGLEPGSATSGSAISTVVTLDAGETVSFDWRFVAIDYLPFNDFSFFTASPFGATELSSVQMVGSFGDSGWRPGQYTAPVSGTYEIGFGVVNALDNSVNSYLGLDHVVAGGSSHRGVVVEDAATPASGTLNFSDVDLADVHSVSASAMGSGYLGSFASALNTDSTGTGNGAVGWSFAVDDGALQYLGLGESLTQTYALTLDDGQGGEATTDVEITILGANDAPSAQAIAQSVAEDGPAVVLSASYADVDAHDSHFFSINSFGTTGLVTNNGDGTFTYDPAGRFNYLGEGQSATDNFSYTVSDNHGGSSTSTATVTIIGQNDAPVAVNDHVGTTLLDFNGAVDLNNYQGFQFPNFNWYPYGFGDGDASMAYEYQYGGYYMDGALRRVDGQNFTLESLRIASNPFWDASGHSITIVGYDDGVQVASATLSLPFGAFGPDYQTFSFPGDPSVDEVRFVLPHDTFNYAYALLDNVRLGENVAADHATDINVLRNDFDPDAVDLISVSGFDTTSTYGATISLNADGTLHYDPLTSSQLHALGDGDVVTDTFTYTITDTHGAHATATVSVDVQGVNVNNQPPVASPDTNAGDPVVEAGATVPPPPIFVGDTMASGNVLANDSDPDAGSILHVSAVGGGFVGQAVQGTYGSVQINSDGGWTYTLDDSDPDTNALANGETATEQFTYTVSDQHGASSSSTLTITINGSEDFTMALPGGDTGSVTEDTGTTTSGQLAAFDPDHGAVIHWSATGGSGTTSANYHYTIDDFAISKSGSTIFDDQFTDGAPPPSAPNFSTGQTTTYITRGFFTEADGRAVMDGSLAQTTFPQGLPGPVVTTSAILATNTDSTNLVNGLKDVHDFTVKGVFDFTVPDANQMYGIGLTDQILGSAGDDLVQLVVGRDTSGSAVLMLRDADNTMGSVTLLETQALQAAPGDQIVLGLQHQAAMRGEVFAAFVVLHGGLPTQLGQFSAFGQIFGTDTPGNTADDERFTRPMFFSLAQGTETTLAGTYGSLVLNAATGHWDYSLNSAAPNVQALAQGQSVTDSFTVFAGDQFNYGSLQTINVTVNGSNDAPVAHADSATTTEHQPVLIDALANDTDVDAGAVLSVVSASAPLGQGTASVSGNQVRFNPGSDFAYLNAGEHATVTLTYTMSDEHGAQSSATVDVTVTGEPNPDGVVYEDGSRRASGQLSTAGLDDSLPLTATIIGAGPGSAAPMANYHFLVDNLSIVRNGSQVFNDGFSNNAIGTPDGTFAGASVQYGLTGVFTEVGGRAIMDGTNAFATAFGTMAHVATLLTDGTNSTTGGLKLGDSFTVDGRFDLVMPVEEHQEYGIRLSDSVNGVGNDIVELAVRRENGAVVVVLRDIDQGATSATATILESRPLNLQPGDNQIDLRLDHAAGSTAVSASFTISGGATPHSDTFTVQDNIFSNESWTRAAVISIAPQLPQNGTFGDLSVDSDGGWVYQTKNNLPGVQALGQDEQANDVFNVLLTDAHGATQTRTVTVAVTGTDDSPIIVATGVGNATLMEGHVLTASGQLTASDPDHGALRHWSVGDHFLSAPGFASGYDGRYHFLLDELQITKNGNAGFFDDNFNDGLTQLPASSGFSYGISGLVGEAEGRAVYDGSGAVALRGPGVDDLRVGILQVLNSNTNPVDTLHGLKSTDSFTASARFDLPQADDSFFLPTVPHAGQGYGLSLVDSTTNGIPQDGLGDDALFLMLEGATDGSMRVVFSDRNVVTDQVTTLGGMSLPAVAGATQIVFHLSHEASNSGTVHASFDLVGPGVSQTFSFADAGHIFGTDTPGYTGDDENWTRVQIVTTSPDTGGSSVHGTYGTLNIDDTGRWTYVLDNSPAVDSLLAGQFVTDTFSAQVIDEHGLSTARPISIGIQGTDPTQGPIFYFGSQADETVSGTAAMDQMAGNGGSDTFVFHSANEGPDTITDFLPGTGAGSDKIDIRDVLAGSYVPGASNIADFVQVADFGDHSTLMVNPSGPAHTAPFVDLAILQNVTGQTLQSLLDNHNLVVS